MHTNRCAHAALLPVEDRTHLQHGRLQRAEGALDLRQTLVGAHHRIVAEGALGEAGADDVEAVEARLGLDRLRVALGGESLRGIVELPAEVLAHLAAAQGAEAAVQLVAAELARRVVGGHLEGVGLGALQQRVALAAALGGHERVEADQQALAGEVRGGDAGQAVGVEQAQLDVLLVGELADGRVAQGGDPVEAGGLQVAVDAYVGLYVQQEVQSEGLVRNVGAFHRFLEAISFSQGSALNVSEVARECSVSRKTVEGFVGIAEDLLLAFRVPVFTRRARRHMAVHPKFFFADVGVFRSLRPSGPLDRPEEARGGALEGLVAQHLKAWLSYSGSSADLYYWRTRTGSEVDFVVYGRDEFWALEVKHSRRVRPSELRHLKHFREDYPQARTRLAYGGDERLEVNGILCLPAGELLQGIVPGLPLP